MSSSELQLESLRKDVEAWNNAFHAKHLRKPTKADLAAVPGIGMI